MQTYLLVGFLFLYIHHVARGVSSAPYWKTEVREAVVYSQGTKVTRVWLLSIPVFISLPQGESKARIVCLTHFFNTIYIREQKGITHHDEESLRTNGSEPPSFKNGMGSSSFNENVEGDLGGLTSHFSSGSS